MFVTAGCDVFICDVDAKALEAAKSELPQIQATLADVSDEASVAELFKQLRASLGGLDVLINNAGIAGPTGYVETLNRADWARTLAVNITGPFLSIGRASCRDRVCQYVLISVVAVSSIKKI